MQIVQSASRTLASAAILCLLSLVGIGLTPGTAQAWNTNININSGPDCNYGNGSAGSFGITLNGTSYNETACGVVGNFTESFTDQPASGELFWCTDITKPVGTGTNSYWEYTYTTAGQTPPGDTSSAPGTNTTAKVNQLNSLLYNAQGVLQATPSAGQAVIGAAIQLAVWAIYYDSTISNYVLNSGAFQVTSGNTTAENDALLFLACTVAGTTINSNQFCNSTGWGTTSSTVVFDFHGNIIGQSQPYQSVAYLGAYNSSETSGSSQTPVPEPSSLLLFGMGLLGLAAFRGRARLAAAR